MHMAFYKNDLLNPNFVLKKIILYFFSYNNRFSNNAQSLKIDYLAPNPAIPIVSNYHFWWPFFS